VNLFPADSVLPRQAEALRGRLGAQLAADREATLRFKGENGIMRKKFAVLGEKAA